MPLIDDDLCSLLDDLSSIRNGDPPFNEEHYDLLGMGAEPIQAGVM
jgi:hypothetical protein